MMNLSKVCMIIWFLWMGQSALTTVVCPDQIHPNSAIAASTAVQSHKIVSAGVVLAQ